jgi:hypothetical protein
MRDDLRKAIDDWKESESSIIGCIVVKEVEECKQESGEYCLFISCTQTSDFDGKVGFIKGKAYFSTSGQTSRDTSIYNGLNISGGDLEVFKAKCILAEKRFVADRKAKHGNYVKKVLPY